VGLEYFVVVQPVAPGFAGSLRGGKALASGEPLLGELAQRLGVKPLAAFFSTDPKLAAMELEELARDCGVPEASREAPPDEVWFSASEGLTSVRTLLSHVEAHRQEYPPSLGLALVELRGVLEKVEERRLQWHLELF